MPKIVQVAVGIIEQSPDKILISQRSADVHQGGLWEFPGGKIESGENAIEALKRELQEELGILSEIIIPFSRISYDYGDKQVCLHNFVVKKFKGNPVGLEGQPVCWVEKKTLNRYQFPAANITIVNQIQLPDYIQITGDFLDESQLINSVKGCIKNNIRMLHFRAHHLNDEDYIRLAKVLVKVCHDNDAKVIVNRDLTALEKTGADGLHLTSSKMLQFNERPVDCDKLFSVSCHHQADILHAETLSADYVFLSPFHLARSHASLPSLGAEKFQSLCEVASCPVYALGGMNRNDITKINLLGGAGVAAISEFWTI